MANQVSDETIESLRQANDVVDVVGEYVQLKKQGRNYFGLCPFHSENTPSFSVNQDKQIYHCFGCGKGGNVITFIMEMEGYSFQQAIQHLAEKSGQSIPEIKESFNEKVNTEEQTVLDAYQWLVKLYHHLLRHSKDGKQALQYLYDRGFSDEAIDLFQIGYSPTSKDFIVQFLSNKGFHKQIMANAGLLNATNDGNYYDRFQGRVIFPIRNHLGKAVGFVGRTVSDQEPKYLNSPESSLFKKSKLLYNFDLARSEIRKKGEVVLFEGSADVISAHQAGVTNGVASLGTSLTESHASLLRRYVDTVLICYDGDNAGLNATYKAIQLLKKTGCTVKVAALPYKYDPDQYIQEYGKNKFQEQVIDAADTEMVFLMKYLKKNFNLKLEGDRLQYVERVIEEIASLESSIERDHYLRALSEEFNLTYDALSQELNARLLNGKKNDDNRAMFGNTNGGNQPQYIPKSANVLSPAYQNAERRLLAFMLQNGQIAEKVKETIGSRFNLEQHQIIVTHLYGYYEEGNPPDPSHFISYLNDASLQQTVVELSMMDYSWEMSEKELQDYIHLIQSEQTDKERINQLQRKMKQLEKTDPKEAAKIAMEIIQIKQQSKNGS
ncbi:DNA primase [Gracilibacillus sp. S3-1-1]|uniref:DNA primase n=1 Tax=Gracilibacillus pellucidus TaxID=3095368 RepID=A0ACC6M4R7_9BACI|nr:DNA primase [Gracilibacillus sp. S3-1-1]MDX8045959.1 DNA primase [Gracilibacillus sp. S3-1-1]